MRTAPRHTASGAAPRRIAPGAADLLRGLGAAAARLDRAAFTGLQTRPVPLLDALDPAAAAISRAADHSLIWVVAAAGMNLAGPRGRRAGLVGLGAVAVTSALVNLGLKRLVGRERPDREIGTLGARARAPRAAHAVPMPASGAHPSGHAASAFAFAAAAGGALPAAAPALRAAAAAVGYSRVHVGVHYPGDVLVGALVGTGTGAAVRRLCELSGYL